MSILKESWSTEDPVEHTRDHITCQRPMSPGQASDVFMIRCILYKANVSLLINTLLHHPSTQAIRPWIQAASAKTPALTATPTSALQERNPTRTPARGDTMSMHMSIYAILTLSSSYRTTTTSFSPNSATAGLVRCGEKKGTTSVAVAGFRNASVSRLSFSKASRLTQ